MKNTPWRITEARGEEGEFCFWEIRNSLGATVLSSWPGTRKREVQVAAAAPELLQYVESCARAGCATAKTVLENIEQAKTNAAD